MQDKFLDMLRHAISDQELWAAAASKLGTGTSAGEVLSSIAASHPSITCTPVHSLLQNKAAVYDQAKLSPKTTVNMCKDCHKCLQRKVVPHGSLVRVDPGCIPTADNPEEQLLQPTLIEETLLALLRPCRYTIVLRPGDSNQPSSTRQISLSGHVVAFPNPSPEMLASTFPCALEDLPSHIQVIFLKSAKTKEEVISMAKNSPALHVRGKQIVLWAWHLARVYAESGVQGIQIDESRLDVYSTLK